MIGVYTLRPYNLFLNPVADGRLDVDRIFSFQSGGIWSRTVYKQKSQLMSTSGGVSSKPRVSDGCPVR